MRGLSAGRKAVGMTRGMTTMSPWSSSFSFGGSPCLGIEGHLQAAARDLALGPGDQGQPRNT